MLERMLRTMLFVGSALSIIAFTLVSFRLVAVTHPVDPAEVSIIERSESFANGGVLYSEPSHPDDPALMPGYPVLTGLLMRNFGPGVWVPRALALACLFLLALLVAITVRIETGDWTSDALFDLFDAAVDERFLRPEHRRLARRATSVVEVFAELDHPGPPPLPKWLGPGET